MQTCMREITVTASSAGQMWYCIISVLLGGELALNISNPCRHKYQILIFYTFNWTVFVKVIFRFP